ncbi:MAG: AAA family ATPase [Mariprofundaceae bacterium]
MRLICTPPHIKPFFKSGFYPHTVHNIECIQTHISWVFLTGDYVYKIKKPVNLGFLDFSTLEQRQHACHEELRLNQRLTKNIYLDVLPISQHHNQFTLGKQGEIIDYCLKMRQFNQHDIFDQHLTSNTFNPIWMDQLAYTMATFHSSTPPSPANTSFGQPSDLWQHIETSINIAKTHPEIDLDLEQLHHNSHKTYHASLNPLKQRQQQGKIKDCHGDLHLKNIALINGTPTPFDCIEFNDEFRIIDVLNDIAFLVMDCDARNRSDLGFRFLSRYLEYTGDYDDLSLLPLYLSYRAGVRGKVACLLAESTQTDEHKKQLHDAQHYFQLAHQYLKPPQPRLFAIGGLSGSGKSHLALQACGVEHAIIIRSDATRKRIANDYPEHKLYSKAMHEITYQTIFKDAKAALNAGFPVILDATFLHPTSRQQTFELATKMNIPLTFLWLDINHDILRQRITSRKKDGADISDADLHVLILQINEYKQPQEAGIQFISNSSNWPIKSNS